MHGSITTINNPKKRTTRKPKLHNSLTTSSKLKYEFFSPPRGSAFAFAFTFETFPYYGVLILVP